MAQTAIQTAIEKLKAGRSIDSTKTSFISISGVVGILRSLLPKERQVIEAAFDEGQEMEYQYHINSEPRTTASSYYETNYSPKIETDGKD